MKDMEYVLMKVVHLVKKNVLIFGVHENSLVMQIIKQITFL